MAVLLLMRHGCIQHGGHLCHFADALHVQQLTVHCIHLSRSCFYHANAAVSECMCIIMLYTLRAAAQRMNDCPCTIMPLTVRAAGYRAHLPS